MTEPENPLVPTDLAHPHAIPAGPEDDEATDLAHPGSRAADVVPAKTENTFSDSHMRRRTALATQADPANQKAGE